MPPTGCSLHRILVSIAALTKPNSAKMFTRYYPTRQVTVKKVQVIAIIRGTKASVVSQAIKQIPASELGKVKEITMDFSDSMYNIAKQCFPNADIVIDCFHIVQRLCGGLEEMRLKFKRLTVTESRKEAVAFAKNEDRKARQRLYYRKKHKRRTRKNSGGANVSVNDSTIP